jgi:hypothetical protein
VIVLGVRHHGPGSARAVRRALAAYQPEVVLIEGPPEADPLVPLAGDEEMRAPVALLAYPADTKQPSVQDRRTRASFWPFAEFSPEWQAIRWAVSHEVPVRFIDLPAGVRLASEEEPVPADDDGGIRTDPIGALAEAAGYDDPERWWEDVVEHRLEMPADEDELTAALQPFEAIGEAMAEVRTLSPDPPEVERREEERREAHMRLAVRAATKEYERIAVICGAWHVPALGQPFPAASVDTTVLRGLPKIKVAMTWVPWTHARLASWQGYGAGVRSPGWYHHLFTAADEHVVVRWLVRAAGVLRKDGVPVSSAHVIEATRLAEALATLRGRPLAGLAEVTDASYAVLCDGDDLRLKLINRRLVVGDRLGKVPDETPAVPIARDVAASQKRLRLPPQATTRDVDLDLRRDMDLARSRLLHRLRLLGVDWGHPRDARGGRGTYWESWRLGWQPEFAVDLVEASAYGTTVREAAAAKIAEQAVAADVLAGVTALVEHCLLADLPDALPGVLQALDDRMALDSDVAHLMEALPALARTLRYGDVRGTDTAALRHLTTGMTTRICVGLPAAVGGLDDSAAASMRDRIDTVHSALALVDDPQSLARWYDVLTGLSTRDDLHGLLAGRLNRLLLDAGRLDAGEVGRRMALVLTAGVPVARAGGWIEGFLAGDGLLLVHDERLLGLVDAWLTGIPGDAFVEILPLLRRTFSGYPAPQRRLIGQRAATIRGAARATAEGEMALDDERGSLVLPTVAALLGWKEA